MSVAAVEPELPPIVDSMICARCDGPMVITHDALRRPRKRCPKCDGVTRRRYHPDEVLVPRVLVRASDAPPTLPPIAPGQLRCQWCAIGIPATHRFCEAHAHPARRRPPSARAASRRGERLCPRPGCGKPMPKRAGRPRKACDDCLAHDA